MDIFTNMDEKLNINERKYTVVLTIKETGEKYTSSTIADHFDNAIEVFSYMQKDLVARLDCSK